MKLARRNLVPPLRRLFWDIETSPNVVLSWRVGRKINIDADNLLHERAIICIGWKWQGESEVHALSWDRNQNDRQMIAAFLKVANSADELVAHNGDKFDAAWFRTRCLFHGLTPPGQWKQIDTLKIARSRFYFNSNRMDYLARYLGMGGKIKTEFGLWKDIVLQKDRKAMAKMLDYCRHDVALLEQVYTKIARYAKPATHAGVAAGRDKWTCPRCGSEKVKKKMTRITAAGTTQHQMQCKSCGGIHSISTPAYKDYLATKEEKVAA